MFRANMVIIGWPQERKDKYFRSCIGSDLVALQVILHKYEYVKVNSLENKYGKNCKCLNF